MSDADTRLGKWVETVSALATRFEQGFEARFGYLPGENRVVSVSVDALSLADGMGLPGELLALYSYFDEVTLPDLGNGIFVGSLAWVVDGIRGNLPTRVCGAVEDSIVVFGSDGGGALIALSSSGRGVYKLSGGALVGSVYDVDERGFRTVSHDLWGFLAWIREELRATTDGDPRA